MKNNIPKRFVVIGLCSLGIVISCADRANMAIAIVFMSREFGWSSTTQGLVLSSFFVGYITTQVLGGALSDKFGGKRVLGCAAACWSAFTLLTPGSSKLNLNFLLLCRISLGISEGASFPSVHSLIASWIPPMERSRAVAIITASGILGTILSMPLSTWLGSAYGWESIFWTFGIVGVMWSLAWQMYGRSYPIEYPGISKEELDLILGNNWTTNVGDVTYHEIQSADFSEERSVRGDSIEVSDANSIVEDVDLSIGAPSSLSKSIAGSSNPERIPWRRILSRREVWAILIPQFCNSWGYYIMLNWLPTYYMDHFGLDITKLGYFAVLPYATQGALGFVVGIIGDYMIYKMNFRVVTVRKTAQGIGSIGTAIFLLMAVYLAKTPAQGIALITIGLGLNAFTVGGVSVSQLDIAPRYAGIIFGLGNTLGTIPGIFGVALTGWILDATGRQWNVIWTAASVMYFIGTSVYVAWMGDEVVVD